MEEKREMKDEKEKHPDKGLHEGKGHRLHPHHGAKTFRRGRAIGFLEILKTKRATIKEQLEKTEFESIQQILIGELKAIDMVISEFTQLFEIHESEILETTKKNKEE